MAAGATFFLLGAVPMVFVSMYRHTLSCRANETGESVCTQTRAHPLWRDSIRSLPRSSLAGVHVVAPRGGRADSLTHDVFLDLVGAEPTRVLTYSNAGGAEDARARIAAFLASPAGSPFSALDLADRPRRIYLALGAFGFLISLGVVAFALRDAGVYTFRVDHRARTLTIARTLMGARIATHEFRVDDLAGLEVESGEVSDWARLKGTAPKRGERFEIAFREGGRLPLSRGYQVGGFHYAVAQSVGEALRRAG